MVTCLSLPDSPSLHSNCLLWAGSGRYFIFSLALAAGNCSLMAFQSGRALEDQINLPSMQVYEITSRLQATASRIELFCKDDDFCLFKHVVQTWMPSKIQEVPSEIQPYLNFYWEITTEDSGRGIIFSSSKRHALIKYSIQATLDCQNAFTKPSKPHTGLDYMTRSMTLLPISRHAWSSLTIIKNSHQLNNLDRKCH